MKGVILAVCVAAAASMPMSAQLNWGRVVQGGAKLVQAMTITDQQMADYCREAVDQMDKSNTVLPESSPYTQRLRRLTEGVTSADGIPLNFKVYQTSDINAFACPDGSVRVYTGIMDIMTDDELLGIIGHEIGHVMKHHSKNAFKNQLKTGALKDVVASTNGTIARLTDSQLGALGESLIGAKYSQKQEKEADNCGYDFLKAHGRNPWGMVMAFEKLQAMEGQGASQSSYFQKMFSSHPDTKSRIEAMVKRCNKDGFTRPTATETKATTTTPSQKTTTTKKKSTKKK